MDSRGQRDGVKVLCKTEKQYINARLGFYMILFPFSPQ